MYNNGVSHITAVNDIDGIASLVKWLSYIPKHKGSRTVIGQVELQIVHESQSLPKKALLAYVNPNLYLKYVTCMT